jgi:putative ABC transport system permease protein
VNFLTDLRFAFRTLLKSPAFTATAILTLALGIGANTAIFSVVDAVLLQPLPYPDSSQLIEIRETQPAYPVMSVSYPNYLDWRAGQKSFEDIAAFRSDNFNLTGDSEPKRIDGVFVTASYFRVLGLPTKLGRTFAETDDRVGGQNVVVLSEHFWRSQFAADPNIIGHELVLNDVSYEVIGVASAEISTPEDKEIYVPFGLYSDRRPLNERSDHPGMRCLGRLKRSVSTQQASADLKLICQNLEKLHPITNTGASVKLFPLLERTVGEYRTTLLLLLAVVGFVLLIACANVANLMLGRSILRRKEIALRAALGASRGRLISQLLTESVLLAFCGGLIGLILAIWSIDLIGSLASTGTARFKEIHLSGAVILFTAFVSFGTGILFGFVPAWKLSRADVGNALKDAGGRGGTAGRERQHSQGMLVISQVALACTLLIGAGLLIQSFQALHKVPLGFDPRHLLTFQLKLSNQKYQGDPTKPPNSVQMANFYDQLLAKIQELPGVRFAALATDVPFSGSDWETDFAITGRPDPKPGEEPAGQIASVSPDYFRAMGIEVVRGRSFTEQDTLSKNPVVIIDESFARKYFPNQDPVGQLINDNAHDKERIQFTIVGVVRTVMHQKLEQPPEYVQFYHPVAQNPELVMTIVLRTDNDDLALLSDVRRAVQSVDPALPVFRAQTMNAMVSDSLRIQRLSVILVGLFSVLALILAAIGIYGVLAYSVVQRTREIGIRLALGAQRNNVFTLIVGKGMTLVGIGLALGVVLAAALAQLLNAFLYGVGATDPVTMIGVIVVLGLTAFLACWLPAHRAIRIDPIMALREE